MAVTRLFPATLFLLLIAGHALAGSPSADHAPTSAVTLERIAAVALAALLVLGLARLRRSR